MKKLMIAFPAFLVAFTLYGQQTETREEQYVFGVETTSPYWEESVNPAGRLRKNRRHSGKANGENKEVHFVFDLKTKAWTSGLHRGKYLVGKYKAQPRISIANLPADHSTLVSETHYDVVPQTESKIYQALRPDSSERAGDSLRTETHVMKNAEADEIEYLIIVQDADGKEKLKFPTLAKVYGRWKIDVSSGVIFNFGLNDEEYYYESVENGQSILRKDGRRNAIAPTVALITHFYPTQKGYFNWGGAFGLGIDDNGKTGWYFGLGALLGDRQRVALSGGIAWKTVHELKPQYRTAFTSGDAIDNANKLDTDELVRDTYRQGWFVAFSYNLSSSVTKK